MIYKILTNAHDSICLSFQPEKWFRHFRWNTTKLSQKFLIAITYSLLWKQNCC